MMILRILMKVIPEKQLEFTQTLLSMIKPIIKETGCLSYAISRNIDDKNRFSLLGEWETRRDMNNHIKSYRFGILLGSKSLLNEPIQIQILSASTSDGMKTVKELRKKEITIVKIEREKP